MKNLEASYQGCHDVESEENNNHNSNVDVSLDGKNLSNSMKHMPRKGSALGSHLEEIKKRIFIKRQKGLEILHFSFSERKEAVFCNNNNDMQNKATMEVSL